MSFSAFICHVGVQWNHAKYYTGNRSRAACFSLQECGKIICSTWKLLFNINSSDDLILLEMHGFLHQFDESLSSKLVLVMWKLISYINDRVVIIIIRVLHMNSFCLSFYHCTWIHSVILFITKYCLFLVCIVFSCPFQILLLCLDLEEY